MLLEDVELTFAYHYWLRFDATHGAEREKSRREFETLNSACYLASLLAVRKINEFFTPLSPKEQKRPKDFGDLKASQFGFSRMGSVLQKHDINKLVVHLTEKGEALRTRGMPVGGMVLVIHARCLEFFEFLEESVLDRRILSDRQVLSRISELRTRIECYERAITVAPEVKEKKPEVAAEGSIAN